MKKIKEIIIGLLLLVLIAAIAYLVFVQKENQEFKEEITLEKEALQKDLEFKLVELNEVTQLKDSITETYNLTTEELASVNTKLENTQQKIKSLKSQLKRTKYNSYKSISSLREELQSVTIDKQQLFNTIDSLKNVNLKLRDTITITKLELTEEKKYSSKLASKLSDATKIQISDINVYAVKESRKGEYKETSRYRKTDAFKVDYSVLNNKSLTGTKSDVFYVLIGVDGKVINESGEFNYKGGVKSFTSGDRLTLTGETMPVTHIIPINDVKLVKGTYTLEFYSLDGLLGQRMINLKAGLF